MKKKNILRKIIDYLFFKKDFLDEQNAKKNLLKKVQEIYDSKGYPYGVEPWINDYHGSHKDFLLKLNKYMNKQNGSGVTRLLGGLTPYYMEKILNMTLLEKDKAKNLLEIMSKVYNGPGGFSSVQKWLRNDFRGNENQVKYLESVMEFLYDENQGGKPRIHSIGKYEIEKILDETIL